jgi:hypothetical protein
MVLMTFPGKNDVQRHNDKVLICSWSALLCWARRTLFTELHVYTHRSATFETGSWSFQLHWVTDASCRTMFTLYIIKSCSHEMAKHKSGVICQFHLTVPPLATTLRKKVAQSVRMGNTHAGSLRIRISQYTNPMAMSKFVSPKTFQSNKSAKNL